MSQGGLFKALERMDIYQKSISMVRALYAEPTSKVQIEQDDSGWRKQSAGIRQGCPSSPSLFLIVMNVMFEDIHKDDHLRIIGHRVTGATFDEVLYADDTILISEDRWAMQRLLRGVEKEGAKYAVNEAIW